MELAREPRRLILEFAGRLRSLADKAYPSWTAERRLEVARNRFIQGILFHSIQLKLLTEEPCRYLGGGRDSCVSASSGGRSSKVV